MQRSEFIQSLSLLGVGSMMPTGNEPEVKHPQRPPYLKTGGKIAITSPAGYITLEQIQPAVKMMQGWGFEIVIGDTIGKREGTLGGSDIERAADFQRFLDDESIGAIMCARGGYGVVRMMDRLNFEKFKKHPKWIIGFSDITFLHSHLNRQINLASIHSKMCNSFPDDWEQADEVQKSSITLIKDCLMGEPILTTALANQSNQMGIAKGVLVGGNLKCIESMAGSHSDLNTKGKILVVEDTGEYLYSIDRMFWNLKRSGKLENLNGLVIGGFKIKPDDPGEEFGKSLEQIVLEKVKDYGYPVSFDFPIGHQKDNRPLKLGISYQLEVTADGTTLREL
ncbi:MULTISPECIES: S66 peptidase family protein [unclassified Paraflavitalea]|uniref:S66 peptidase family protein n=1 Tax=unclassified Paraflavitalea TaxID=2798305 RepID=UPI003D345A43